MTKSRMVKLTVALLNLRTFNIITQDEYDIINKRLKDIMLNCDWYKSEHQDEKEIQ